MIIIYRKSDLVCVGTVAEGMTIEQEIELNVTPNFGGAAGDYNLIETQETSFHLENINGVITPVKNIVISITPEPNQDDYLLDLDFRLSMIELGL